ncbi:MAG: TolC family protein [Armatimonadota bacterium]|nr:TolC family protein [Armatimonadota bacterium]
MPTVAVLTVFVMLTVLARPLTVAAQPAAQPAREFTLAALVAAADERNPAIAAARQAVQAAEAAVALARSGRGPTFTASGSVGTAGGGTSTTTPSFSSGVSISSSYVLYDSGQIQYAVRQAEANLKASRLSLEAVRQDVAQTVALAYVSVLRAERAVRQREQVVVQNRELLRLAEGQFRAGVVARADVVRAQAGLASAEGELIAAQNVVAQSKAALNQAIGASPLAPIAVIAPPPTPSVTIAATELANLVEQRPEIRRALAQIEAAEAAVLLAQAGGGLRVTLDGRATQSFNPNAQTTYSVSSGVSFPLSDAGRTQAAVAQAAANLAAARANIETTRLSAQQQATSALLGIVSARARIESARAQLAFAQESLRLAQGRYAAGAGPFLEVIDAQTALVLAEVTLATAEYDELAAAISLRYALGRSVVDGAI